VVGFIKWTRIFGDTIFALGAICVVLFVAGLVTGHSFLQRTTRQEVLEEIGK